MMQEGKFITTCTPLRLSFAGGGTDLPEFYRRDYGAVFSTAIDKHLFVTIKPLSPIYGRVYRLNYSDSEQANSIDEIKNAIARECLRLVPVEPPLYISTIADLPAYSGLGSSSSFAVGLLNALHAYRGERVSSGHIAEEAAHVEIEILKRPMGKQDHFAAAYGGLNYIRFRSDGGVSLEPQNIGTQRLKDLFDNLMLFWTGMHRDSSEVLRVQQKNIQVRINQLTAMRDQAMEMRDLLSNGFDVRTFGAILDAGWNYKKTLADNISNGEIKHWYSVARNAGAYGGKICGAGGGGFLLFVVKKQYRNSVRKALHDLIEIPVGYEPHGSHTIISMNN